MTLHPLWALALTLVAAGAAADTAYVTDILRLGIHEAADTSDKAFDNLVSGTPVEVLERSTSYARVRLADGREGWVRSTFLVTEKPAAARIAELTAELEAAQTQAAAAKTAQSAAEHELSRVLSQTGSVAALTADVERLEAENASYAERLEGYRQTLPLVWVLLAVVVSLAAGFAAGLWWLDALIRRRHGGFRVY
jgi:SH3 domain protein